MVELEERLRALNVIEQRRFTTAAGYPANRKINLEKIHKKDPRLAAEIAGMLAIRLCLHSRKPDVIVPVPSGGNLWAQNASLYMRSQYAQLEWTNKRSRQLGFASTLDCQKIAEAERIALVDDVFTSGSTIKHISQIPEIADKVVVAGVVWKRSAEAADVGFPVESLIDSYVPLIENE